MLHINKAFFIIYNFIFLYLEGINLLIPMMRLLVFTLTSAMGGCHEKQIKRNERVSASEDA